MYNDLMAQENDILSENTELWEKVFMAADKGMAMIEGYQSVRPLSTAEIDALPILSRGSALRFFLTRLYDWLTTPAGALVVKKDPLEYYRKLRFHRGVTDAAERVVSRGIGQRASVQHQPVG